MKQASVRISKSDCRFFAGKLALVTGGASGLGRLLILSLARAGCRVVAWDLNQSGLDQVAAELREMGAPAGWGCTLVDITQAEQVYSAARDLREGQGVPDIVVNSAGVVSGKSFLDTPDAKIRLTMEVNAMSLFWMGKAFLPGMIARNSGHFVTISSAAGIIGVSGLADYSASKFAAFGFDEALRMELHKCRSRIRSLVVCPFFIDTGMFAGVKTRVPLLLPILKPERVVRAMITGVRRGRPRLVLPAFVGSVWLLRLLPVSWLDATARLLGVNASMDSFSGRG